MLLATQSNLGFDPAPFLAHDRHHQVPCQFLHESLSQAGLNRIQRTHPGAQVTAQCCAARSITGALRRKACGESFLFARIQAHSATLFVSPVGSYFSIYISQK